MKWDLREVLRITVSMTVACVLGAVVLGGVYVGTERYRVTADRTRERAAIQDMLDLPADATMLEVRQYLAVAERQVRYRVATMGSGAEGPATELAFSLDGELLRLGPVTGPVPPADEPLGRVWVASQAGQALGFVIEGESRGYKNRIRFFVALSPALEVKGVRVVQHEEDPGLGAEIATPWFQAQFVGRTAAEVSRLDVTRDPMPEDWYAAVVALSTRGESPEYTRLLARERTLPIHAVTGATISSRALTRGVRTTVDHFARRWALIAPHLGGHS